MAKARDLRELPDHYLKNTRLIALDGIPAAGKTTTLNELKEMAWHEFTAIFEPVSKWQTLPLGGGEIDLLEEFYKNPTAENINLLQFYISYTLNEQAEKIDRLLEEYPDQRVFTDRSVLSNGPFINTLEKLGLLSPTCAQAQLAVARVFQARAAHKPVTIYFSVPPPTCMKRIARRERAGEQKIDEAYLTALAGETDKAATPSDFIIRPLEEETPQDIAGLIYRKCF